MTTPKRLLTVKPEGIIVKIILILIPLTMGALGWTVRAAWSQLGDHETRITVVEKDHNRVEKAVQKIQRLDVMEERITQQHEHTQEVMGDLKATVQELAQDVKALRRGE